MAVHPNQAENASGGNEFEASRNSVDINAVMGEGGGSGEMNPVSGISEHAAGEGGKTPLMLGNPKVHIST